ALDHVHQFPATQEADGRRRSGVSGEVSAGSVGGFAVLSGEDSDRACRLGGVLQRTADSRAHLACRTTADGIHDDHQRAFGAANRLIYRIGCLGFFNADARQLFAHRDNHDLWIHSLSSTLVCIIALIVSMTTDRGW